jgi:hypothetical protein
MRFLIPMALPLVLAACEVPVPDSAAGVGFDDRAALPQEQLAAPLVPRGVISDETVTTSAAPAGDLAGAQGTAEVPAVDLDNPGISDEQDFTAVAERETIESDRARIEAQRQAYQFIAPTDLPPRPDGVGPLVVQFALSTTNKVGEPLYPRPKVQIKGRFERNCAKYASSDLAQEAFLKAGGPERDRYGIDPDGDGFACYWDPMPFRLAVQAGASGQ